MRILQVIWSLNPSDGGPIEGVLQTSRWSSRAGNQIELMTMDDPDDESIAPLVRSCPYPVHLVGPVRLAYGYTRRSLPWLRRNLPNYDIAIINGMWQYQSFAVRKAARETGTPYVVFPHGMLDPYFKHAVPWKHRKKALYWKLIERRVLGDAAAVAFTCEQERILARQSFSPYKVKEAVVGYGASEPEADMAACREAFLDLHPSLRDRKIALFLGRIHPKKGCDLLLKAFTATLAADSDWRLVLAGPDSTGWQATLVELARTLGITERVLWPGMLTGELKWGAFAAAEVFVLPSHQENFGIAVVEALACGVPVLISRKVNIWEEIVGCGAGLSEDDTLEGTTNLLNHWNSADPAKREAMRVATRPCFFEHFEARTSSNALDLLLAQCIAAKKSQRSAPAAIPRKESA